MFSRISSLVLKLFGWSYEVPNTKGIDKYLIVVIPHTSNWDFPVGILLRSAAKLDARFLAKDSLFKPPYGWIFRALGGYPVDRSGNINFVDSVVKLLNTKEKFSFCLAPEGTRKKVIRLKSGFYFIALGAKIPYILCKFDWKNKHLGFSEPIWPTGDYKKDLTKLEEYFKGSLGKIPENGWQKDESPKD